MDFIIAATRREDYAWTKIKEICEGAARRLLKEDIVAIEDVVSNAIMKLIENIENYEPEKGRGNIEGNFIEWVNKTVEFEFLHYRDRRLKLSKEEMLTDLAFSLGFSPDDEDIDPYEKGEEIISLEYLKTNIDQNNPEKAFFRQELYNAVMDFPDERIRKVIVLHFIYGHTATKIAKLLNEKETTINNWIYRNKKRLKKRLIEKGIDENFFNI